MQDVSTILAIWRTLPTLFEKIPLDTAKEASSTRLLNELGLIRTGPPYKNLNALPTHWGKIRKDEKKREWADKQRAAQAEFNRQQGGAGTSPVAPAPEPA